MSLSCSCDGDSWDGYYTGYSEVEYKPDANCRCESCGKKLSSGELVLSFEMLDTDEDGEEIELPTQYLCEKCGDIFSSLEELGFCMVLGDNMQEALAEYRRDYVPKQDAKP